MEQIITAVKNWWTVLPLDGKCAVAGIALLAVCVAMMVVESAKAKVDEGEE